MRLGIRSQLFIPLGVMVVGLIGLGIVVAWQAVENERATLGTQLDEITRTLDRAHFPLTRSVLVQMKGLTGADYCLFGAEANTTLEARPTPDDLGLGATTTSDGDVIGRRVTWAGANYFMRTHRPQAGHPNAGATLVILYPVQRWEATVAAALRPVVTLGAVGLLIAAGMTLALGGRLVARIRELDAQTRRVAAGDFAPMPLPSRDDELRHLAVSVNSMAERLRVFHDTLRENERWRLLGQMAGGLAHQLRNGVTGAKLALQLHAREAATNDSEPFQVALRQLTLIESQLQRFLEFGRAPAPETTPSSLADVAAEAVRLVRPRCQHLGIRLEMTAAADLPDISADRGQLLQVLLNLMDNAIDASGPNGAVELRLHHSDGTVKAEVCDSGAGPPPTIAKHLFEPFVTGKPDGIGLGLSVVRRVVESHQGAVAWERVNGRTCFRVSFPACNPAGKT